VVATWAECRTALAGVTAARMPALDQVVLIGMKDTLAAISAPLPFRKGRRREVAKHRRPAHAQLPGNGLARAPLAVPCPHLLSGGQPSRPALAGELLSRRRGWGQWDGDGHRAIRVVDRGLTPHLIDRREHRALRTAHLLQGLGHIVEQGKAVRDLGRLGGALTRTVRLGFRPIARHDLDPRRSLEPWHQGASLAIG
jgi:hypothetical protein